VGPNHSGKSETLKEIESWPGVDMTRKILSEVHYSVPSSDSGIDEVFQRFNAKPKKGMILNRAQIFVSYPLFDKVMEEMIELERARNIIKKGIPTNFHGMGSNPDIRILSLFLQLSTLRLDGRTRFNLVDNRQLGDLLDNPPNFLSSFYLQGEVTELSKLIFDEFGFHFYLDPTGNGSLRIRMNREEWKNRKSLEPATLDFFKRSPLITSIGDGIQAFTGLLLGVMSYPSQILLIDEPEAFLHPPAIRSLGNHLSRIASDRDASLIVSTHSPDFLMGLLDYTSQVTIIRLTYSEEEATATQLSHTDVNLLRTVPLLRSTDVLSSLFHRSTIITEGNIDRVFYTEINRRIDLDDRSKSIRDTVFLDALGKNVVHRVANPLRKIGLPAACIYDLDILRAGDDRGDKLWKNLLEELNYPAEEISRMENVRAAVQVECDNIQKNDGGPDRLKNHNVSDLPEPTRTHVLEILNSVKEYGIFIVPVGQVECWLQYLGVKERKEKWIGKILDAMEKSDIKPINRDVWKFLGEINEWIKNPYRLGMDYNFEYI
jgi:hypothetical protein